MLNHRKSNHPMSTSASRLRCLISTLMVAALLGSIPAFAKTMQVFTTATPTKVVAGGQSLVRVVVVGSDGRLLQNARVDLSIPSGRFQGTNNRNVAGLTNHNGEFVVTWTADRERYDANYLLGITVNAAHHVPYDSGKTGPTILVTGDQRSTKVSALYVSTVVSPTPVIAGGSTGITVTVKDQYQQPIQGATVTLPLGGGTFVSSNTSTAVGKTGSNGVFLATWKTLDRSVYTGDLTYVFGVHASSPGYADSTTEARLTVTPNRDRGVTIPGGNTGVPGVPVLPAQRVLNVKTYFIDLNVRPERQAWVPPGGQAWVWAVVKDQHGDPVHGADVSFTAPAGTFTKTGTNMVAGKTNSRGYIDGVWSTLHPSAYAHGQRFEYVYHVEATLPGAQSAQTEAVFVVKKN